jgi:hypothetical protein
MENNSAQDKKTNTSHNSDMINESTPFDMDEYQSHPRIFTIAIVTLLVTLIFFLLIKNFY